MACEKCEPFGGLWMETDAGLRRCECEAGRRLSVGPVAHPPRLTSPQAMVFVEMLAAIPFFPAEPGARGAIGDEIRSMCGGAEEALWLVTRMRRLFPRWPGPAELRRVYASKYLPWDGVQPIGISEAYPEGIPSEATNALLLSAPAMRMITAPMVQRAVDGLVGSMPKMPAARPSNGQFEKLLAETLTAPQERPEAPAPTPQVITQSDIDRAVAELRQRKGEAVFE